MSHHKTTPSRVITTTMVATTTVSHSPPKRLTPPTKKTRTCRSTTPGQQKPTTKNDSVPIEIVLCFPSCSVKKQVKITPVIIKKDESTEEEFSNYDGSSFKEEPTDDLSSDGDFPKECYDQGGVMPIDELSDVDWVVPYDELPSLLCNSGCPICLD